MTEWENKEETKLTNNDNLGEELVDGFEKLQRSVDGMSKNLIIVNDTLLTLLKSMGALQKVSMKLFEENVKLIKELRELMNEE